ncbi:MAG: hypothetical protein CVU40_10195 [Chloroflexi bacterium HGW-Chloroflexi-2]|nr:MAG: hypothetical protein CVU40_10195 [Chloroflexi bacterium HGW-Chloroflexi-2]
MQTSNPSNLQNIAHYLIYKNHLSFLFNKLKQNDLPFLVLKGWSFIPDLYPDPSLRPFSDIDILIHPADYHTVTTCMAELGYSVRVLVRAGSKPAPSGSKPAHPHIPLEITFSHPAGIHIDLHTHLLTLAWWQPAFPIDLDHIWHTAQPYPDSTGLQLQRLSPEVTFLHLCLHLWNHEPLNPRFHSYIDLVLLLRKYTPSMHWDHILHLADQWGMQNILSIVTQILHRDYHTTLPIQINPKSPPTSLQYKYIHSQFSQSLKSQSSILNTQSSILNTQSSILNTQTSNLKPQPSILNPPPWLSSFLLRLALIDTPTILPKLLWNALFPSASLRTAIHNQPRTLLQHWGTYTHRLLKS